MKIATFQHMPRGLQGRRRDREPRRGGLDLLGLVGLQVRGLRRDPVRRPAAPRAGRARASFNSDSDELARRLNIEAAKAVKYGGLAPAEALAFVTSNPAKQLGIFDRIGSLEAGKDGDFVVWSGDPLSSSTDRARDVDRGEEVLRPRRGPRAPAGARAGARGARRAREEDPGARGEAGGRRRPPQFLRKPVASGARGARKEGDAAGTSRPDADPGAPEAFVRRRLLAAKPGAEQRSSAETIALVGGTVHPVSGPDIRGARS